MRRVHCQHEECEPYNSCQAATRRERERDFWLLTRAGWPEAWFGTDPLAWLNGDTAPD
jgi:hypothetical protein